MNIRLTGTGLGYRLGGRTILHDLALNLAAGELTALLGTNGAGKTTLLRLLLGLLPAQKGTILIEGRALENYGRRALARAIAYVPQGHVPAFPYTAEEIVMLGRLPFSPFGPFADPDDREAAGAVLQKLAITHLAQRPYTELSGGERQAVLIARALAQGARILILDEPETGLDFGQQMRLFAHLRQLAQSGYAILATTHDPLRARSLFDRAILLQNGRITADGPSMDVLTDPAIENLYGIDRLPSF